MSERPSFYAIIPATVRYDNDLCANAKLLYGEITALSEKHGYCFASNSYFAKIYGVSNVTVSRWIGSLKEKGYLSIEIDQENGNVRHIKIDTPHNKNDKRVLTKTIRPINKNVKTPINKNDNHINTRDITTDNTTRIINKDLFEIPDYLNTPDFIRGVSMWADANLQKNDRPLADLEIQTAIKAIAKYAKGDIKRAYAMIANNHETVYRKMYEPKTAPTPTSIPHKPQQETIKLSQPKQR